eukprot:9488256-Pyramimonas_sp.AAC.1
MDDHRSIDIRGVGCRREGSILSKKPPPFIIIMVQLFHFIQGIQVSNGAPKKFAGCLRKAGNRQLDGGLQNILRPTIGNTLYTYHKLE